MRWLSWPNARAEADRDIWVLTHPDLKETARVQALTRHPVQAISAKRHPIEGTPDSAASA